MSTRISAHLPIYQSVRPTALRLLNLDCRPLPGSSPSRPCARRSLSYFITIRIACSNVLSRIAGQLTQWRCEEWLQMQGSPARAFEVLAQFLVSVRYIPEGTSCELLRGSLVLVRMVLERQPPVRFLHVLGSCGDRQLQSPEARRHLVLRRVLRRRPRRRWPPMRWRPPEGRRLLRWRLREGVRLGRPEGRGEPADHAVPLVLLPVNKNAAGD